MSKVTGNKIFFRYLILALGWVMLSSGGMAGVVPYPSGRLTLICPWAEGGGTDRIAREVAQLLELELKQPVDVIDRIGDNGLTGFMAGANAEPNGYSLVMLTAEISIWHWLEVTTLDYQEFQPIAMVNRDSAAILVRADAPWKNFKELQRTIKDKPGTLRASGAPKGGIWHIAMLGWLNKNSSKSDAIQWIVSQGAEPGLQKLITGQVDLVICSLPEANALLAEGKVRALAVMAPRREKYYPNIPTLKENGIVFSQATFRGIGAPLGTPPDVVKLLERKLAKIIKSPAFIEFMEHNKFGRNYLTAADFLKILKTNDQVFEKLIKRYHISN
jgi:tripartite-type tricarboxylate transporter receptor subunit TctC